MATENFDEIYSLPAAADYTTKQGYPIVVNTSGQVAIATAGQRSHGHLHNAPASGKQARFVHNGKVVKGKVGTGGVTLGSTVVALTDGYGNATNTGYAKLGIALAAGAALDVVPILMIDGLGVN